MGKSRDKGVLWFVVAIVALVSCVGCDTNTKGDGFPGHAFAQLLERNVLQWMKYYQIPGVSIALVEEGQPVWAKAWGYAEREVGRPLTLTTRCRVESISKSVTAWGVLKLVDKGRLELDAPITNYLRSWSFPLSSYPLQEITVRRLLSHTSGLGLGTIGVRYRPEGPLPSLQEALSQDAKLVLAPGTQFSYSNVGFNLLELLIEEVTGRDFSSYMREEILGPLGMEHSSYSWNAEWDPPVPNGYSVSGNAILPYVYPEKGAGGLFATVEDIARFIAAGSQKGRGDSLSQKVLSSHTKALLFEPQASIPGLYGLAFPFYGFGHFLERFRDGTLAVSHGGQGSGWMSHFHLIPVTGEGIVILTNSQRSWPFFARVLRDWAQWKGYSPPGMSRIIWGERGLWLLIWGILLFSLGRTWIIFKGILRKERRFYPLTVRIIRTGKPTRSPQIFRITGTTTALILLSILSWAHGKKYFFLTALFPRIAPVLGFSLLFLSFVLLLDVLVPRQGPRASSSGVPS